MILGRATHSDQSVSVCLFTQPSLRTILKIISEGLSEFKSGWLTSLHLTLSARIARFGHILQRKPIEKALPANYQARNL